MKRRVIGLLRVSTNAQDLERQKVDVQRVVASYDLDLVRSEEVDGVSGRHVQQDPQFQKVFRDLKRADIAGVAVSALDRLFRPDFYSDFAILDHFRDNKKLIFSSKEGPLDPATDAGFMMSLMSGAQAGMEWRELRRRSLQGKEVKRRQGRHVNSPSSLPRGVAFDTQTGQWRFEEPDRSRIEKAFELLFRGVSYRDMAEEVGGGWSGSGLQRALTNPVWRGVRRYDVGTRCSANRREEAFEVAIPIRLMSDQRFEEAQKIIRDRHSNWAKSKRPDSPFLALGLLKCNCGKPYFTRTDYRPGKHHWYYCASRHPNGRGCGSHSLWQADVDEGIKGLVSEYLLQPELLRVIAAASLKQMGPDKGAAAKLAREMAKLDGKRKRFIEMRGDAVISREELAARLGALDRERDALRALLPQETPSVEPEHLVKIIVTRLAKFPYLALGEQREQLQEVVKEFGVRDGAIDGFELAPGFLAELQNSGAKALPQYLVSNHFRAADKLLIRLPEPYVLKAVA